MLVTRPTVPGYARPLNRAHSLQDGIYPMGAIKAILGLTDDDPNPLINLGVQEGPHTRGLDIIPVLTDASDGDVATVRIHRVSLVMVSPSATQSATYRTERMYDLTVTAGGRVYPPTSITQSEAYRAADTVVLDNTTSIATHYNAVTQSEISVHSPGNNEQAIISIPDLAGAYAIIIEADVTTGSGGFVPLVERKT